MVNMPQKKWKSLSIPEDVWNKIKEFVESNGGDYKNPTDFILDSVRRRLEELEKIRLVGEEYELSEEDVKHMAQLEHTNVSVNGNRFLIAVKDHTDNRIYDVYISPGPRGVMRFFCDGDKSFNCVHVKYVRYVLLPKLNELIEEYKKKKKEE